MKTILRSALTICIIFIWLSTLVRAQDPGRILTVNQQKGYLEARYDSVRNNTGMLELGLVPGPIYHWEKLTCELDGDLEWSRKKNKLIPKAGTPVNPELIAELAVFVLNQYENQGYPFAKVYLSDVSLNKGGVKAVLAVEKGTRVRIDSLISRTEGVVSSHLLTRLTGLNIGDWYSQKSIVEAQKRLVSTNFLKSDRALEVGFFDDKAWVYLTPLKQSASRFDALVGFAPGNTGSSSLNLTGHVNLKLVNLLRQAESFEFKWEAPGSGTQRLVSHAVLPYLMGWPIGISGGIDLYKRDSSYLTVESDFGLRLSFQPGHFLDLQMVRRSSNTLAGIGDSDIQEFDLSLARISYRMNSTQPRLHPRRAWFIEPGLAVGKKQFVADGENETNSNHLEADIDLGAIFPLGQQFGISLLGKGGYQSGLHRADNEKYRLGGYTILRGFQEESILADIFTVCSAEFRIYLSDASNLHVFSDFAWISNRSDEGLKQLFPYSFGAGLQLQTRAGILRLDYAIGTSAEQAFSIQNGLIHMGIQSIF